VWATTADVNPDPSDPTEAATSILPGPGGSSFLLVTFPPDSVMADPSFDPAAAGREHAEESPGLVAHFEPDAPGMHTTPTVDYGIVLDGEIWLELDDGKTVHLKKHDVVVQNGTRHAWRNKSAMRTKMAFVLLGQTP
jgi:quercetin dioxygenase-like cupin family protein